MMQKLCGLLIAAWALLLAGAARAEMASDQAAAILLWPDILYTLDEDDEIFDTIVQLSNTSTESILVHCFYENANSHCTNTGEVCSTGEVGPDEDEAGAQLCCNGDFCGRCVPGWLETDFRVRLTPRQPLGWRASAGLGAFPLTGVAGSIGPDGSSNAGSRIPPLPEDPFTGLLKCVAINDDGTPSDRNVLKGEATYVAYEPSDDEINVSKYNAVGLQAIQGAVDADKKLCLGGGASADCPDGPEYDGCPNFLLLDHFFDQGLSPVAPGQELYTRLVLVPCTQDLLRQIPGESVIQFLVYNEFEQRFSTSRTAECKFESFLSSIDTSDPDRSIFSAGVAGTLAGQTRMNPIGSGQVGVAMEFVGEDTSAYYSLHYQGDRPDADLITLP
jgi:hypothetical protein